MRTVAHVYASTLLQILELEIPPHIPRRREDSKRRIIVDQVQKLLPFLSCIVFGLISLVELLEVDPDSEEDALHRIESIHHIQHSACFRL